MRQSAPNIAVLIVADEKFTAGERDYAKAVAAEIVRRGPRADTRYLFYKISGEGSGDPGVFPVDDAKYAAVPPLGAVPRVEKAIIVGCGHSTLDAVVKLKKVVGGPAAYITHIPETAEELRIVAGNGLRLFAATSRESLAVMDAAAAAKIDFTRLEAVPNTNTEESCRGHYEFFLRTEQGQKVRAVADSGAPFIFAVLNAGFEVGDPKIYRPYLEAEAAAHGGALGEHFEAGTHLILAHGGPRSLRDEGLIRKPQDTHAGQNTMEAFGKAYLAAQQVKGGSPHIFIERFDSNTEYNAVKAGFILGAVSNCVAFISSDEGFGTKASACGFIDNRKKLLGSFQFSVEYTDITGQRQAAIEEWHRKGVAKLSAVGGKLVVLRHPQEQASAPPANAAATVLSALGLLTSP